MSASAGYTDGRFVLASTDARGARDPIGLTSQVKFMREGMQDAGHNPALILVVVAEDELDGAVARIKASLDAPVADTPTPGDAA